MILRFFNFFSLIFFISEVASSEFDENFTPQSLNPNNYKIQVAGIEQNGSYIKDVSNEDPDALRRHIDNIKTMKLSIYDSVKDKDTETEFFRSSLREFQNDELSLDWKVFYGVNHEYISSKSIILYKCFLFFAQTIRIVAPKINIGDCFFIPSSLLVSIIFECPEEIDCSLRSIEIVARDSSLSQASILSNRCPQLKDICNGTSSQDNSLHFEGWIDFTAYRHKKNAIFLTIDKNWLVKFNFRS